MLLFTTVIERFITYMRYIIYSICLLFLFCEEKYDTISVSKNFEDANNWPRCVVFIERCDSIRILIHEGKIIYKEYRFLKSKDGEKFDLVSLEKAEFKKGVLTFLDKSECISNPRYKILGLKKGLGDLTIVDTMEILHLKRK